MAYESFEEKYFGSEKPLGQFLREAGIIAGGTIKVLATFPTSIRKTINDQTRIQREDYKGNFKKILGASTGFFCGIFADIYALNYAVKEASQKNYAPAIALGLTNLASLFYEIGRKEKSKQEHAEMLEERAITSN